MQKPIIFTGPSLTEKSKQLISQYKLILKPPVRRNDILKLLDNKEKQTLIVVDGFFKYVPPVGHRELLKALKQGNVIYGLSSMGAIRAYEMKTYGMIGYGEVFNYFNNSEIEDFEDDEVALLHSSSYPFKSISEPLIHFRVCIEDLTIKNLVDSVKGEKIISTMKNLFFEKRTKDLFFKLLLEFGIKEEDVNWVKNNFSQYQIKQRDLEKFLENKVWQQAIN